MSVCLRYEQKLLNRPLSRLDMPPALLARRGTWPITHIVACSIPKASCIRATVLLLLLARGARSERTLVGIPLYLLLAHVLEVLDYLVLFFLAIRAQIALLILLCHPQVPFLVTPTPQSCRTILLVLAIAKVIVVRGHLDVNLVRFCLPKCAHGPFEERTASPRFLVRSFVVSFEDVSVILRVLGA